MACICGHSKIDEHGNDPEFPGSTACNATIDGEPCDCIAYEWDGEGDDGEGD